MIEVERLCLSYGKKEVVRDISFSLVPGRIIGIVGPNGCGKSSIVRAISRVLKPVSGSIKLNGREITCFSHKELACLLGVVPQIPLLPSGFTAFEVVLMGRNPHLGFFQYEGYADYTIARKAMEQTGVTHLAESRVGELSGGEIQSIVIARVLTQQPQVILMDEPTSSLDIGRQTEILDMVRQMCREHKMAICIVLHDLNLAVQYCDRLILINNGRIVSEGTPEQVITKETISEVYGAGSEVHNLCGFPIVIPRAGVKRKTDITAN